MINKKFLISLIIIFIILSVSAVSASDASDNDSNISDSDTLDESLNTQHNNINNIPILRANSASVDMELKIVTNQTKVAVGDVLTYNLILKNKENARCRDQIRVTGFDINGTSLTGARIDAHNGTQYTQIGGVDTWVIGYLLPNQEVSATVYLRVNELKNFTIAHSTSLTDSNPSDNYDEVNITVVDKTDLNIDVLVNNFNPDLYDIVEYTVIVNNIGGAYAEDIIVNLTPSSKLEFINATYDVGRIVGNNKWRITGLDAGETIVLKANYRLIGTGTIPFSCSVETLSFETDYSNNYAEISINSNKLITNLSYIADKTIFKVNETASVSVKLENILNESLSGKPITFIIDNIEVTNTTDSNGVAYFYFEGLSIGNYSLSYTFIGDDDYLPTYDSTLIKIKPEIESTILTGNDMTVNTTSLENFVITLTNDELEPLVGQRVFITFNRNVQSQMTDTNGQVKLSLYGLNEGNYTIFYNFNANEDYTASIGNNTIIVKDPEPIILTPTIINGTNISMLTSETKEFTVLLTDINGTSLANQNIVINFDIKYNVKTNDEGYATIILPYLDEGNYTISYNFYETNEYEASEGKNNIEVILDNTTPPSPSSLINTVILGNDYKINENTLSFYTVLQNVNGTPLVNKPVFFLFNGITRTVNTNRYGQAIINLTNLLVGNYTIIYRFNGDNQYNHSYGTNSIQVEAKNETPSNDTNNARIINTRINSNNLVKVYGTDTMFNGTLTDTYGRWIPGQHIEIKLTRLSSGASKTYDVVSDYIGEFTLPINLAAGTYYAEITYKGLSYDNTTYLPSNKTNNIIVTTNTDNRTATILNTERFIEAYNAGKSFTGTLTDYNGNPLAGHHVSVNLTRVSSGASKVYDVVVDYLGILQLNINLARGEYTAQCSYAGTDIYQSANSNNKITVY